MQREKKTVSPLAKVTLASAAATTTATTAAAAAPDYFKLSLSFEQVRALSLTISTSIFFSLFSFSDNSR
jgi:hypothetical protein